MYNAMIIDPKDDVVVAIEPISKGDAVTYLCDGREQSFSAGEDIPIYHKAACRALAAGAPVSKYGAHIGVAACDILQGAHVHVHNLASHRENLDGEGESR